MLIHTWWGWKNHPARRLDYKRSPCGGWRRDPLPDLMLPERHAGLGKPLLFPQSAFYVPEIAIIASTACSKGGHSRKALITIYLTPSKSYGNISMVDALIITSYFSDLSILIHVCDMFISRKSYLLQSIACQSLISSFFPPLIVQHKMTYYVLALLFYCYCFYYRETARILSDEEAVAGIFKHWGTI